MGRAILAAIQGRLRGRQVSVTVQSFLLCDSVGTAAGSVKRGSLDFRAKSAGIVSR
jgi:hypothetical protein